jgi:ribonuclease Z
MGKITVLGNCAYQTGEYDTVILIDAGPGVVQQLYNAGYDATDIDAVFLTHKHPDHIAGYPYFVTSVFAELIETEKEAQFDLFCTENIKNRLEDFVDFSADFIEYEKISVNFRKIERFEERFEIAEIEPEIFPTKHAAPSFGIKLGKVVITGDTAPLEDQEFEAEIIFHEATTTREKKDLMNDIGHSVASDAGKKASEIGADKLYLMNPNPEKRANPEEMMNEAQEEFDGEIKLPTELEEIRF